MRGETVVAAVAVVLVAGIAIVAAQEGGRAIGFTGDVPSDVRALADDTWRQFDDAFAAWRSCYDPPVVAASRSMADRGVYDPATGVVTVRIPWTAANLQAALVHEFAHHVEFTCEGQAALRDPFLEAMGVPSDTPWRGHDDWTTTPSERYAEATVVFVLGRPPHVIAGVTKDEVGVVAAWASDDLTHRP